MTLDSKHPPPVAPRATETDHAVVRDEQSSSQEPSSNEGRSSKSLPLGFYVRSEPYGGWQTFLDVITRKPLPPGSPHFRSEPYGDWRTLWEMVKGWRGRRRRR